MKQTLLIISGWAHGIEAIRPMGDALSDTFDVQLITGNQVLKDQTIPDADFIITGSMGGLLAMERLPDACKKLVLISSTAKFCAAEDYPCGTHEKILKRMILQLKRNPAAVMEAFFTNVHYPRRQSRKAIEETRQLDFSVEELAAGLDYLLQSDLRETVPKIDIPVLLMHGTEDRIIPVGATEWLHANLPDSMLKIFENDGHALPAHHFSDVIQSTRYFLAQ